MSRRGKVSDWVLTLAVVIVLGCILIALLLPAVQSAREAARRTGNQADWLPASVAGQGRGPGLGGDKFQHLEENDFIAVADEPLSTFSIDVDTASYSKLRSYLTDYGQLPPQDAIRTPLLESGRSRAHHDAVGGSGSRHLKRTREGVIVLPNVQKQY